MNSLRPVPSIVVCFVCLVLPLANTAVHGAEPAKIDTPYIRLTISPETGYCEVLDKEAGVTWRPDSAATRFGTVTLDARRDSQTFNLAQCTVNTEGADLVASFSPKISRKWDLVRIRVKTLPD